MPNSSDLLLSLEEGSEQAIEESDQEPDAYEADEAGKEGGSEMISRSPDHQNILIGTIVTYISSSGKTYNATVDAIPENPWHDIGLTRFPTVALSFRDERGKLVRKTRVLPREASYTSLRTYKMKTEG
jgi:hypothetical protein